MYRQLHALNFKSAHLNLHFIGTRNQSEQNLFGETFKNKTFFYPFFSFIYECYFLTMHARLKLNLKLKV